MTDARRAYLEKYRGARRAAKKQYDRRRYAAGLKRTPPSKPCVVCGGPKPKGHGRRYCEKCEGVRNERRREQGVAYRIRHREAARFKARQNYSPEKQRDYRARTIERQRAYGRAAVRRRKARKRQAREGDLATVREYDSVLRGDPCSYCGGAMEHADHIEALATGGADTWENLTAACASCNSVKRTKPLLIFLAQRDG